ncbi:MAG: DoxX family protein [Alphaproteobacteria bacterium]|nr:DoxX family protein [Alphaproteobacteria bacterium]
MPINSTDAARAAFLLRITLGVMFLAHGVVLKWFVFTLPGTAAYFESLGLPGLLAYAVFAAEAGGGVLLILGIATRWVALAVIPILLGATWTHAGNGWVFSDAGGGWEYPAMLVILAIVQALLGAGAYALRPGAITLSKSAAASAAGR